jgi:hypothetical protein
MTRPTVVPRATPRDLRAANVEVEEVEASSPGARVAWDRAAPWQTTEAPYVEEWAFRSPRDHGATAQGVDFEVFTLPRRGRPRYVGPRDERDVWKEVAAGIVAHVLLSAGDGLDEFHPPAPAPIAGDPLATHLLRWLLERAHDRKMNPRDARGRGVDWPTSTLKTRLHERRRQVARDHGVDTSSLWRVDCPDDARSLRLYRRLPRWWLWRKTWPGLHALQREDPLPATIRGAERPKRFIPVFVRLLGDEGQPDALRVYHAAGFAFTPMPVGVTMPPETLTPCTATISRAALGSSKLSAAWRAVIDQPPEAQGKVLGTTWEGWEGEEEPSR